jgi:sirohydrochlorin cobaltochelatase
LCDSECNGACETNNQNLSDVDDHPVPLVEKNNDEHHHKHEDHHHHHHSIYPNSKHPLGPVTLRLLSDDQILRNSVEKD